MNIHTGNFFLKYHFEQNPGINFPTGYSDEEAILKEAISWLRQIKHYPEDIKNGYSQSVYYHYVPPDLKPAVSLSEANIIRINFFRQNIDKMKILPPDPNLTPVSILIANANKKTGSIPTLRNIVEARYIYYSIDRESSATYPLKAVSQAWKELNEGRAYVASLGENEDGQVIIRKVYLAYYDSIKAQNFLQPIYVFEGDRNFYAYVAAIDPGWQE